MSGGFAIAATASLCALAARSKFAKSEYSVAPATLDLVIAIAAKAKIPMPMPNKSIGN
jgi:hypothetical protein